MRLNLMSVAIAGVLIGGIGGRAEDLAADAAIRDAIKTLQSKKVQATKNSDKEKIDLAISALEKVLGKAAATSEKGGEAASKSKDEILKEKFGGRAVWDEKTGELTLTYDFKSQEQMKDFDLDGSKAKLTDGTLKMEGKQKFTHVVRFKSVTATADVTIYKPLGFYLGTTNDLQLYIHDNWEVSMWLDGQAEVKRNLPRTEQRRSLRCSLTAEEKRFTLRIGSVVMGGEVTDKPRNGQIVLMGGHNDGANFRNLVIKGDPDPQWLKTFIGQ